MGIYWIFVWNNSSWKGRANKLRGKCKSNRQYHSDFQSFRTARVANWFVRKVERAVNRTKISIVSNYVRFRCLTIFLSDAVLFFTKALIKREFPKWFITSEACAGVLITKYLFLDESRRWLVFCLHFRNNIDGIQARCHQLSTPVTIVTHNTCIATPFRSKQLLSYRSTDRCSALLENRITNDNDEWKLCQIWIGWSIWHMHQFIEEWSAMALYFVSFCSSWLN